MNEFEILARIVEDTAGVAKKDLISKRRFRPWVELRMICTNVLKENHPRLTVETIGHALNINHATVSYHLKTHKNLLNQRDGKYKSLYEKVNTEYLQRSLSLKGDVKNELLEKRSKLERMIKEIDDLLQRINEAEKQTVGLIPQTHEVS